MRRLCSSSPLLDRIDIHIQVPHVDSEKLSDSRFGETSSVVRQHVEAARKKQHERFAAMTSRDGLHLSGSQPPIPPSSVVTMPSTLSDRSHNKFTQVTCTVDMHSVKVCKFCALNDTERSMMRTAMNQLQLSTLAYHRVLKLSSMLFT